MTKINGVGRSQERREGAAKRLEARAKLTNQEQLARLDFLFGVGLGAQKERTRLLKLIAKNA